MNKILAEASIQELTSLQESMSPVIITLPTHYQHSKQTQLGLPVPLHRRFYGYVRNFDYFAKSGRLVYVNLFGYGYEITGMGAEWASYKQGFFEDYKVYFFNPDKNAPSFRGTLYNDDQSTFLEFDLKIFEDLEVYKAILRRKDE